MEMPTAATTTTDALELNLNKVFEAPDKKTWEELDNTNINPEVDALLAINDSDDQRSFEEKLVGTARNENSTLTKFLEDSDSDSPLCIGCNTTSKTTPAGKCKVCIGLQYLSEGRELLHQAALFLKEGLVS